MFQKRLYLDYAALTPIDRRIWREMKKYSSPEYANPSSWYKEGVAAENALENGRKRAANFIQAHSDEIFFTSGGTEANNLALIGPIEYLREKGIKYKDLHILASEIEHSSIRECLAELRKKGAQTDFVAVDSSGIVKLDDLKKKIKPNTVIVSVMAVNNEIGAIQPIREIAKIIRQARQTSTAPVEAATSVDLAKPTKTLRRAEEGACLPVGMAADAAKYPIFHTDAAQAFLQELNVEKLGVDLLTLDGGKMYGPRGIGCLYVKRNTPIRPIIFGGGQENGLRSGTENIPAIMGFAQATDIIAAERERELRRIMELRECFLAGLKKIRSNIKDNVVGNFSPHILNVSIPGIDNEFFLFQLDAKGVACSTKSSCLRDEDESYVLKSIGADGKTSIRFSFGRWTKRRYINRALEIIGKLLLE
jgi:cysteine desulfurase